MADVVLIGVIVGFFALCGLYVRACAGILAADEPDEAVAAPELERVGR